MALYQYRAREAGGVLRDGEIQAGGEAEALLALEGQGLLPIRLVRAGAAARPSEAAGNSSRGRVGAKELITFTRQLETLLESGVSLTQSLAILADQTPCVPLRNATSRVRERVEQGQAFAEALSAEPRTFPSLYVSMVQSGEEGGVMALMLERTATLMEHEFETRERVKSALFYPCLVLSELLIAMAVLVKLVLPRFAAFFKTMGAELPLPTRIMMGVSDFVEKNGIGILVVVAAAVLSTLLYVRTPRGRWQFHMLQIRVPILGDVILKTIMSRFARALAALIASGVPITVGLLILKRIVQNVVVEEEINRMHEGIVEGRSISDSLRGSTVFPPLVVKMLAVGEETGSLDKMLVRVSGYFDRDVEYAVKNLTAAIEPILLAVMGASVLMVALAVFLPMWNLMKAVNH